LAGVQEKSYEISLSFEDRERYRHIKQGKRILAFTVQYETLVEGEWRPVIRYDTAHGVVHKDILDGWCRSSGRNGLAFSEVTRHK
jgi:hypothetical protein